MENVDEQNSLITKKFSSVLHSARISNVENVMWVDGIKTMVNYRLANEIKKMFLPWSWDNKILVHIRSQTLNYYFCDLNLFLWLNLLWLLVPLVKMIFLSLLHPMHIFLCILPLWLNFSCKYWWPSCTSISCKSSIISCTITLKYVSIFNYRGTALENVKVLCLRDQVRSGKRETSHSLVLNIKLPMFTKTGNYSLLFSNKV